jgi:hypothetical protein
MPAPSSAERAAVRAPAVSRTLTRWTTSDIEVAEAITANGNLSRAADLCWAALGDGRVRAALETRTKGLIKLPLAWEGSGDGRSSGRVIRALEGGDFYAAHSEAALVSLSMWAILLGVGVAQRVWTLRNGRWIGVVKPYDARCLRWDTVKRAWMVRTDGGSEVEIRPGDRRWVLYAPSCSGEPDGDERPWMYGAWRAIARPWLGKLLSWGDWMHHSELHGSGVRTADWDPPAGSNLAAPSKAVREDLADTLGDLSADAAVVPVPGYKLRLLEAAAKTWEMFPGAIQAASQELVISITGQSSSTEITQGQDTGATLHGRVRQDLIDADAQTLSTCLRERCLTDYAALNFGDAELAPWPRWKTDPPANAEARGRAMSSLGAGIEALDRVAPEGKRVDRGAVFEAHNIPLEDAPAPVLSAPPAPQEPPAP